MKEKEKRKDARLKRFWQWFDDEVGAESFREKAHSVQEEHTIYPEDVEDRLAADDDDFVVIDTRELDQYEEAHLKGAINVPLDDMLEDLGRVETHRDKTIALCCNTGSTTSFFAAIYLLENGFENVFNLDQGIQGWVSAGGETESGS
jgi:rhodanese-related sulfurtransferase